jgi:hypothetical protein
MNKLICGLIALGIVVCLIFDGILTSIGLPSEYLVISLVLLGGAAVTLDWATGKGAK